ncbi:MAG: TspO/MBR family protein [Steroidobacteraceae bacterium]
MLALQRMLPLCATLIVIAVNAAANLLPINGYGTGELSDLNPTGFTPAGWAFSIWSLIYLGLLTYAVAALGGSERTRARAASVATPYLVNAAANVGWIFAWHYRRVELSFAMMLAILGTLTTIYVRLRRQPAPSAREFVAVDAPFSLYFGWITIATFANLGTVFFARHGYPFAVSMDEWALVSVSLATAIYVWMGAVTRDLVYSAVFVWAAPAIAARPTGVSESVRLAALAGAAAVTATMIWAASRRDRGRTTSWDRPRPPRR